MFLSYLRRKVKERTSVFTESIVGKGKAGRWDGHPLSHKKEQLPAKSLLPPTLLLDTYLYTHTHAHTCTYPHISYTHKLESQTKNSFLSQLLAQSHLRTHPHAFYLYTAIWRHEPLYFCLSRTKKKNVTGPCGWIKDNPALHVCKSRRSWMSPLLSITCVRCRR